MKYCKDCKHYKEVEAGSYIYKHCYARLTPKYDIVTGELIHQYRECEVQRLNFWLFTRLEDTCGREGRWYEPKEVMP